MSLTETETNRPHQIGQQCGIGLRAAHIDEVIRQKPKLGFLEVHTENYFGGGIKLKKLEAIRCDYPLSFHGVGLSLGRADGLDEDHIQSIKSLIARFEPSLISEHLSFSGFETIHAPDLLALPLTNEALGVMAEHVDQVQNAFGRQILIENPSNYLAYAQSDYSESAFLSALCARTGCGILLDINNIYVSAHNLGRSAYDYLSGLDQNAPIGEYHMAGHLISQVDDQVVLIDTHGDRVCDEVLALYEAAIARFGDHPSLLEWDTDIPALSVLLEETAKLQAVRTTKAAKSYV